MAVCTLDDGDDDADAIQSGRLLTEWINDDDAREETRLVMIEDGSPALCILPWLIKRLNMAPCNKSLVESERKEEVRFTGSEQASHITLKYPV